MKKIRLGILGGGGDSLIGVLHRVASFINDNYEITGAVFNPVWEENIGFAEKIGIPANRIYKDFDTLIAEELKLPADERIQVLQRNDVVHGRAHAGAQELVLHALANHDVVAAHAAKQEQARGHLAVAQQGRAGHRVVPVAVAAGEGQHGGEAVLGGAAQRDAAAEGEGQPDQAAHLLPEPVAGAQAADEGLAAFVEGSLPGVQLCQVGWGFDAAHEWRHGTRRQGGQSSHKSRDEPILHAARRCGCLGYLRRMSQRTLAVCSWSMRPADAGQLVERVTQSGVTAVQLALVPLVGNFGAWSQALGPSHLAWMFQTETPD